MYSANPIFWCKKLIINLALYTNIYVIAGRSELELYNLPFPAIAIIFNKLIKVQRIYLLD